MEFDIGKDKRQSRDYVVGIRVNDETAATIKKIKEQKIIDITSLFRDAIENIAKGLDAKYIQRAAAQKKAAAILDK